MNTPIQLTPESLASLYGDAFYISPADMQSPQVQENVAVPVPKVEVQAQPLPQVEVPAPRQELASSTTKPGIVWKPKPTSRVLFVLQLSEFKNPELTELLKKIVDSLGIAPALVGFGQIDGPVDLAEFDAMPNPHAVVFDPGIWGGAENPVRLGKGDVFFSQTLAQLQGDQELKKQLWAHLKTLKEKLG